MSKFWTSVGVLLAGVILGLFMAVVISTITEDAQAEVCPAKKHSEVVVKENIEPVEVILKVGQIWGNLEWIGQRPMRKITGIKNGYIRYERVDELYKGECGCSRESVFRYEKELIDEPKSDVVYESDYTIDINLLWVADAPDINLTGTSTPDIDLTSLCNASVAVTSFRDPNYKE